MTYNELLNNIRQAHPKNRDETDAQYNFWLEGAMNYFPPDADFEKAWEKIKLYDGHIKRPRWEFFKEVAGGTKYVSKELFHYYKCNRCGAKLSDSSLSACPLCGSTDCESYYSYQDIQVLKCQTGCFNCSIYTEDVMCATCEDFGTPAYRSCLKKNDCPGRVCCKYEFLRKYDPKWLASHHDKALESLPRTRRKE